MKNVCKNKWCKATFETKEHLEENVCPKCRSLATEMSGGVEWNEKTYEGPRMDMLPHQMQIKVNRSYK